MSAEPSTLISYAPPIPRWRWWLRRVRVPVILLFVLGSSYWWGPPLWDRATLEYWYGRCNDHEAAASMVVWEMRDGPPGWVRVRDAIYVPEMWKRFYAVLSPPGFKSDGTAFLGGRQMPGGRRVLVAVDILPNPTRFGTTWGQPDPEVHIRVFAREGAWNVPKQLVDVRKPVRLPRYVHARVFVGSIDPNDPTHFTILYGINEDRFGTIHGWVRGNDVDLEVAPPNLTPPLQASPG